MKINDNTKLKLSESSYQNYNIGCQVSTPKGEFEVIENVMTLKMVYVLMPMHQLLMESQTRVTL